jgi:hypothetical protein
LLVRGGRVDGVVDVDVVDEDADARVEDVDASVEDADDDDAGSAVVAERLSMKPAKGS